MSYQAKGVFWDGTNDQARRAGELTGVAPGRKGMLSLWWRSAALYTTRRMFFYNSAQSVVWQWNNRQIELFCRAGDNDLVLVINNTVPLDDLLWHHILLSWDLDLNRRQIYIDGAVPPRNTPTLTVKDIFYGSSDHRFGYFGSGSHIFGDTADFYFNQAESLDFDVPANLAKFYGPGGGAVDLGDSGELPTGTAPIIYFSRRGADTPDDWVSNKGTGGGFTLTGSLGASTEDPPKELITGSADGITAPVRGDAVGRQVNPGDGHGLLSPVRGDAVGRQVNPGDAHGLLSPVRGDAQGIVGSSVVGSAHGLLAPIRGAAEGVIGVIGSGVGYLPLFGGDGSGTATRLRPDWPLTLPQFFLRPEWGETGGDGAIRSDLNTVILTSREITSAAPDRFQYSVPLTIPQKTEFENFYNASTAYGSISFMHDRPGGGQRVRMRFVGPPTIRARGSTNFVATGEMEILVA